ncbi:ABC transporter permease [Leeuwenhoekiella parthenopeia]|uniref:ABC transporter permease n=1 Tax=Leeuwenhoekiella parthenopeia TaxID=2890320 RepID=A0ABS8GTZ9_9FLAO|nr:ABC transporter permease [Leeuwenhoekiella parthenopeia]MCC4212033.1 ABC transporter permease [Leeuwenhoekiella parthenopeia]
MLKNYIKIAWRNLVKNKLSGFITIGGLAVGLTACTQILFYVAHERSYDSFHTDSDRIYAVEAQVNMGGDSIYMNSMNATVGELTENASPAVSSSLRLKEEYKPVIITNTSQPGTRFSEKDFSYADANFFDFFSFKLKNGNTATVLSKPYSLVLSEDMAKKYFGNQNPIGETLSVRKDSTYLFTVTGVMENTPSNSSLHPDFLASLSSMPTMKEFERDFDSEVFRLGAFPTYLKLTNPTAKNAVENTMQKLSIQGNAEASDVYSLSLLTDKHLNGRDASNTRYIRIFPLIAVLILLLALVNYLSLSTARATLRSKEIGVRKVNGASRKSVAFQFYVESTLYVIFAFLLSVALSVVLNPWFFSLLDIEIDASFFLNKNFLLILTCLLGFTVLATGFYPALVMSAFNPVENLRSSRASKMGEERLRKVCTTVQFVIAIALLISGIIIHQQLDYVRGVDTGLNRSDVVMVTLQNTMGTNSTPFRNEIEKLSQVTSTAVAQYPIYKGYNMFFASSEQVPDATGLPIFSVDDDFFKTLGVTWETKPDDENFYSKSDPVIINEAAISKFKLGPNPIGESLLFGNSKREIVGVVKDFHFENLDAPINAVALFVNSKTKATTNILGKSGGCLFVRFQPESDVPQLLSKMETIYTQYDSATPFEYQFLDDAFDTMFRSEERLSHVFNLFIILAMLIAGMGLFALATFSAQQRMKELGVRKVLGASVLQLTTLLSFDFLKLILLAILIASPLAWYFMHEWLQDFNYKTTIHWWVFLGAGAGALVLAILTVSFQAIKAALANPVKSLRTE